MLEKDFANKYQKAYWEIFALTGDPRFMQLFMHEEREREKNHKLSQGIELGR